MRRQDTSETSIHLTFLMMNLQKILRDLFAPILVWLLGLRREKNGSQSVVDDNWKPF